MSDISSDDTQTGGLLWALAGLSASAVGGGLALLATGALPTAVIVFVVMVCCLALGWWAAGWQIGPDLASSQTKSSEAKRDAPFATGDLASTPFLHSVVEAAPTPVVILDANGRMIATNNAARTRFQINSTATRFQTIVRRPDIIEAIEGVLADGIRRSLQIESRVPLDRYERFTIAAFDVSAVTYVLITVLDETEARMSERMRADFLANASHELRTPLAAIIGFIETLRGPAKDDGKARERFLEVMHLQADRMSRLISDLLSLSRIELNEHVQPTGLSNIAAAAFEAADVLTPDKKERVIVTTSATDLWVLGDRDEMGQVLVNLIDNALKYSQVGSKVRVLLRGGLTREAALGFGMRQWENAARLPLTSPELERDRLYSVIRVENDGDGIERQHLPRLSERFFRVEDTASGKSGTGLGLAIVKHIVSRHRGGLVVESEIGRGSAFSVYLPQPMGADAGD
jgi:two-component system, OmpR family, phosphate regulon sensor histidine kinase PhoR